MKWLCMYAVLIQVGTGWLIISKWELINVSLAGILNVCESEPELSICGFHTTHGLRLLRAFLKKSANWRSQKLMNNAAQSIRETPLGDFEG